MSPNVPVIREAVESDAAAILHLTDVIFDIHHRALGTIFRGDTATLSSELRLAMPHPDHVRFVAQEGEDIIGFVEGYGESREGHLVLQDDRWYKIDTIVVAEKFRSRGVGKKLMAAIERFARDRGYRRIELNVYAFNETAIALYTELGLVPVELTMSKLLPVGE
ncbi:MAG TPA: GNAT family N-acetyltransferase [bacterium]|nr:GNAT family N-acetyltransferase [bacterium]